MVDETLVAGFGRPTSAHRSLLHSVLLPLHRPAGRRDATAQRLSFASN